MADFDIAHSQGVFLDVTVMELSPVVHKAGLLTDWAWNTQHTQSLTHTEFDSLTYDRHTYINLWCVTGDFSKALPKQIGFSWWVNMKFLGNSKMPERNSSSV